ncbi:MAG: hypothetical protein GY797_22935 [Deltaproteobacteria bacterium]|nr:hypothetical protein [Deltaproteobacteria bacterium]
MSHLRKIALQLVVVMIFQVACNKTNSPERPVLQLENLVYEDFFNPSLQLELARSYWSLFLKSSKTDEKAASQSLSAYVIACIESGDKEIIYKEFIERIKILSLQAGFENQSFHMMYDNMKLLYNNSTRKRVKAILQLRDEYRSLWATIVSSNKVNSEAQKAYTAAMNHIKVVFDVEVGRKLVHSPNGGNIKFAEGFYSRWNDGLRSYGILLPEQNKLADAFVIKEVLHKPIQKGTHQIETGSTRGYFFLDKKKAYVVAGIKYFQLIIN